jgi:hypothetical protein
MSDSDSDSFGVITRKGRIYRKRNLEKENKVSMIKYYSDPEKREKLKVRIKTYEDTILTLNAKVAKLKEYLAAYEPQIQTQQNSE